MFSFLHLDPTTLIQTAGLLGVCGIIFAESGLPFGFFLPGDSLLFTAGLLASQGLLNFPLLLVGVMIAAIAGDNVGYWLGSKIGPRIFTAEDSFFFNKRYIDRTREFYEAYGPKAIVLARFAPVIRTFTPILAGVGQMRYPLFLRYNILGGFLWAGVMTVAGYTLGRTVPESENYLSSIIVAVIVVSFMPIVFEIWKQKRK